MAGDLGFSGAPIEGQPILVNLCDFFIKSMEMSGFQGLYHAHYQNMVVEGESVRACGNACRGKGIMRIGAEKEDGTPVLTGTASIGSYGETEIDIRMSRLRPSEQLVILSDLKVGQLGAGNPESVRMGFDQNMGSMYPFSLAEKLRLSLKITSTT